MIKLVEKWLESLTPDLLSLCLQHGRFELEPTELKTHANFSFNRNTYRQDYCLF